MLFGGLIFREAYFRRSLLLEGILRLGLTIKTDNSNSPWAYIREGLLSEAYLRLRFRGGVGYFWEGLLSEFCMALAPDGKDGRCPFLLLCDH